MRLRLWAVLLALVACKKPAPPVAVGPGVAVTEWTGDEVRGISGLARHPDGRFFAIPERVRAIVAFEMKGPPWKAERVGAPMPLAGVPEGTDTESLAFLGPDRLAIGTETLESGRDHDDIAIAVREGERWTVKDHLAFSYAPWSTTAKRNEGIEALCGTRSRLIAVSETAGTENGARYAPLGAYDLEAKRWTPHRLFLTSEDGKISSIACRESRSAGTASTAVDALAIERHFATMRILKMTIDPRTRDVRPQVACDLRPLFEPAPPNFEGIEWLSDEVVVLVSDNDYHGVTGPTVVAALELGRACGSRK